MVKTEKFVERLALLGIITKEDKGIELDALYNPKTNELTYNSDLLRSEKVVEILLYFSK